MKSFEHHVPGPDAILVIESLRHEYSALAQRIELLPPSRERSIAMTELETSAMWAIKAAVFADPESKPKE